MDTRAYAMADELPYHRVTARLSIPLNRTGHVAHPAAGLRVRNSFHQRAARGVEQCLCFGRDVAARKRPRVVAVKSGEVRAHVDADDVALLQNAMSGYAVDDLIVHRDARRCGKAMVVQKRRHSALAFDHAPGNAIQLGARTVKNTVGALIEPMIVRDSSQRTKSMVGRSGADAKLRQWAKEQYVADQQSAMGGGKYSEYNASGIAREIEEKRRAQVFGKSGVGKAVNAASRWNTAALDRGDVLFNRPAYVESFAQALKAKGVTAEEAQSGAKAELVAAAREYAINEAQKATYRNTTDLSELLARAGHYQGGNKAARALSIAYDAVMPFRKTPANILTTGLDYSPVGIAKAVKQAAVDVKSGKATAADAVDSLCEGLTGTGILALGAYLTSEGLLNLRAGGDDDEEDFNKALGHQDYALELGGRSYTLDWAVPAAIPLFAGAALVEGGMDFGGLMDAVSNIGDVVLETSMLSTFNDIIRNISYADNPMASAVGRVASSYASQFLPTVGGKIASALDDTVHKSYVEGDTSQLERDAKYFGQTVLRKTPFLRARSRRSRMMRSRRRSGGSMRRPARACPPPRRSRSS